MSYRGLFTSLIIVILLGLFFFKFDYIKGRYRDYEREVAIKRISNSLKNYYRRYGWWPKVQDQDAYGWDLSYDGENQKPDFLDILKTENLMNLVPVDPINDQDYNFRYKSYPAGSFGCKESFFILQINKWETSLKKRGEGDCPAKDFTESAPDGYTVQVFKP